MGTTNLDTLELADDLIVHGDAEIVGTLTAGSIVGNIATVTALVGTADNGTSQTLTPAMIASTGGGVWVYHTSTGGATPSLTLPLAADIISYIPGWTIGDAYSLRIINSNSGVATVVTNTGVTLTGTATINNGSEADFVVTYTGTGAVSVVRASIDATNNLNITASTGTLTIANGSSLITAGAFSTTLTATNTTTLTLPTTGTLATLAGAEALTNKTITAPVLGGSITGTYTLAGTPTITAPTITTPVTSGLRYTPATTLTAVGTDRATSLALTADINNITTAAASTGATLPASTVGRVVTVFNNGANAIQVYGAGSDTIDGTAGTAGVVLTNAKRAQFFCVAANTWISAQLGVVSA